MSKRTPQPSSGNAPPPRTSASPPKADAVTHEHVVDEMVEETFPASDATQLPGRADCAPPDANLAAQGDDAGKPRAEREAPRTIGNQGVIPASRNLEDSVELAPVTEVSLRLERDLRHLHVQFSTNGANLDAAGVDRLIAALSSKRAQMTE